MHDELFTPVSLGAIDLTNRIVMAPMTRSRAGAGDAPTDLHATYYRQRASAGLIISEGTQPSPSGKGYARTPGIYSAEQIQGWRRTVDSVAASGGNMVMQVMHCGRVASRHNKAQGAETVAPSGVQAHGQIYTDKHGMVDFDQPRALQVQEIAATIAEYQQAAINAFSAGFAGVELHATSGYLPAQFLSTGTNQRTDRYGGSVRNRIRFVVEVLEAMASVSGADRVGMRICPGNPFNDLSDHDPKETFTALLKAIAPMKLAYLHVIRRPKSRLNNIDLAQAHFPGPLLVNESYSAEEATAAIRTGQACAVSFARHFIANPDLVAKFRTAGTLATLNPKTLYTPGAEGYVDY